jgi:hypothetical protein
MNISVISLVFLLDNILLSKQNNIIDEKTIGGTKILTSTRIYSELPQYDTSQSLNVNVKVVGADMGVSNEKTPTPSPTLNLAVGII